MDTLLVGELIEKCMQLEHALESAGASGSGLKELMASLPLDAETEKTLKFVRRVRNACAHDGGVSDGEIREALQQLTAVLEHGITPKKEKKKAKKTENVPHVRHFLFFEIALVVIIYAVAFGISLTPRALNIATIIAFYLVFSWEIVYASRCGNRRAFGVEAILWCLIPLMTWCGAPQKRSTLIIAALSGTLPLIQLGIVSKCAFFPVLDLLLAAIAGTAIWYYFGIFAGIAAGGAVAMLLSFAIMAKKRK